MLVTEAGMVTPVRLPALWNALEPITVRAPSVLNVTPVMPSQYLYSSSGMDAVPSGTVIVPLWCCSPTEK